MATWVTVFRVVRAGPRPFGADALARWRAAFPDSASGTLRTGGLWLTLPVGGCDERHARILGRHRVQEFFPPPEYRAELLLALVTERPPAA